MTEPRVIAEFSDYQEFLEALRNRPRDGASQPQSQP
jgi:hypothetical protein